MTKRRLLLEGRCFLCYEKGYRLAECPGKAKTPYLAGLDETEG